LKIYANSAGAVLAAGAGHAALVDDLGAGECGGHDNGSVTLHFWRHTAGIGNNEPAAIVRAAERDSMADQTSDRSAVHETPQTMAGSEVIPTAANLKTLLSQGLYWIAGIQAPGALALAGPESAQTARLLSWKPAIP
jgi:hypothetical protein